MHRESRETSVVPQGPDPYQEKAFTDRYQVVKAIGNGGFCQVILARHLLTGAEVAVKVLEKMWKSLVLSEILAMTTLNHPNVIQLFQVIETHQFVYLVMEHGSGGTLCDIVPPGGMRKEKEARRLFRQITSAVCHCHQRRVVHGDLKPENIVLDATGNIRVVDFGFSTMWKPGKQRKKSSWSRIKGPTADSWDLGVILYFILTGNRLPGILYPDLEFPQHVSARAQGLVRRILAVDTRASLSAQEILEDPWLDRGKERLSYPDEPLPNLSDPAVLTVLFDLGFDPYSTGVSLSRRKFDDAMACYLIIQQQMSQGAGGMKPVRRRVAPRPCPRDPSIFPALPRRRASEPALHSFPLPCAHQPPEEAKESGQKSFRSASVPAIRLRFLHGKSPTPSPASQHDTPEACTSSPDSHVSQDATTGSRHGHGQDWKRVRRRIAACFRRLCCCLPSSVSENQAPAQGERKPAKFRNWVVPT